MKKILLNKTFITILFGLISLIISLGIVTLIIMALIKYIFS